MITFLGVICFIVFAFCLFCWIVSAVKKMGEKKRFWRNGTLIFLVVLVILVAIDGGFSEEEQTAAPEQETQTEQETDDENTQEEPEEDPYKSAVKELYEELNQEYEKHKESYDEVAWAAYMREFKDKHEKKAKEIEEEASTEVNIAMNDLMMLANEMTADLQGRDADIEFFKNSVEEAVK